MNPNDLLNQLLSIEKLCVTSSEFVGVEQLHLVVESTLAVAICPECQQVCEHVHDLSEAQLVRDLPMAARRCALNYRARRFECPHCRKTFVERVAWKRPGVNYTLRYEQHIYQRARQEPVSQVAHDEGLSEEAVQAIFEQWAKKRLPHAGSHRSK